MTSEIGTIAPLSSGSRGQLSWGTVIGVLLLGLYLSYQYGYSQGQSAENHPAPLPAKEAELVARLKTENTEFKQRWLATEQQYQTTLEAKIQLENYLKTMEKNNARMTRDMALNPMPLPASTPPSTAPTTKATFNVTHFQIFPTYEANSFRYMLLLTRKTQSSDFVTGVVSMTIQGRMGNKLIFIPVKYGEHNEIDGLAFHCQEFQELSGELTLPEGFEPMEVILKVQIPGGIAHKQQIFPWQL